MYIDGLIPANPINVYQNSSNMDDWYYGGTWSPTTSYSVGGTGIGKYDRFTSQTPGTKTKIEVDFKLNSARNGLEKLYLIADSTLKPNEVIANAIATADVQDVQTVQTAVFDNISVSGDSFYLVLASDSSDYTSYFIQAVRAVTSYTVFPELKNVQGPTGNVSTSSSKYFSADIQPSVGSYNPFTLTSASLRWRAGSAGPYSSATMALSQNNTRASVDVPGGTFSEGVVEWYIAATANTGDSPESALATFNSSNYFLRQISAVSPNGSLAGNNSPISFEVGTPSGFADNLSRFDLQYSTDGALWVDFGSITVENWQSKYYTAPANTFPAGTIYWRVRAIAINGGVGQWSDAASFEAIGASVVTNLAASAVPFSTVTWEVTGELAYRVMVDDKLFGPYRDPDAMSYTLAEPLTDGEHTIKVQAQNKYGLWSAWAEVTVNITNVPGTAVVVTGEATTNGAELTITGGEQVGMFLIYRDGAYVARTPARLYKDRTALGRHAYYVIQAIADGYYTKSNTIEVVSAAECPEIALLSGGDFLTFGYADGAYPEINVTRKTNAVKTHYSGAKFPTVETGDQEELSVSFGTFWLEADSAAADQLEAMQGKAVILKYPPNHVLVGVLDSLPGVDFGWKRAYTIYLEQMEWRDFTDES